MRFKIYSKRVLNCLKARGFKAVGVIGNADGAGVVMLAPDKWRGIVVEAGTDKTTGQKLFKEKTRVIVERIMKEPTIGLRKPKKQVFARQDPMPEIFDLLSGGSIGQTVQQTAVIYNDWQDQVQKTIKAIGPNIAEMLGKASVNEISAAAKEFDAATPNVGRLKPSSGRSNKARSKTHYDEFWTPSRKELLL